MFTNMELWTEIRRRVLGGELSKQAACHQYDLYWDTLNKSHYLFEDHFCLVRRANEKGHVERLLGFARSHYLVPVPQVDSLAELNA